jgi:hypothetical protein
MLYIKKLRWAWKQIAVPLGAVFQGAMGLDFGQSNQAAAGTPQL